MCRINHSLAYVDRIYITRKEGELLIQLESTYKATTIGLKTYLRGKYKVTDISLPLRGK